MLLAVVVILYNVRTRQLHGHPPYLDLYEWLLWTSVITFGLLLVYSVFVFDFFFVVITIAIGLATFVYARFIHFPPLMAAYEAEAGATALLLAPEVRPPREHDPLAADVAPAPAPVGAAGRGSTADQARAAPTR